MSKVPKELLSSTNILCYVTGNNVDAVVFNSRREGDPNGCVVLNAAFIGKDRREEMRAFAKEQEYPHFDIAFHQDGSEENGEKTVNNIVSFW